jgi:RNA polymerase sigma-70 factor (ECF subfamily)
MPLPPPPDAAALSVADLAELGAVFEAHWDRLVAIARRRLDDRLAAGTDPEDVVSQAFLDARRKWGAYRARRPVSEFVWLYGLVADRVVATWRAATRERRDVLRNVPWPDRPSIDLGFRLVAAGAGPGTEAERKEAADLMRQAIARLKDADRDVIMLRGYDELGFKEIGELLGVTENTATVRYVRALRRLKAEWHALAGRSRP